MTTEGKAELEEELKRLTEVTREELKTSLFEAIKIYEKTGDDSDMAIAKDRQSFNEFRIQELSDKLSRAEGISSQSVSLSEVQFGSKVTLETVKREGLVLKIVGIDEANIRKDKISIDSPAARALLGKRVGDLVQLNTPNGKMEYTIIELSV